MMTATITIVIALILFVLLAVYAVKRIRRYFHGRR